MGKALFIVAISTACASCVAQEASVKKLIAQSQPAIQTRISEISDALNQSTIESRQEIEKLKDSNADKSELVKQVAVFAAGPSEQHPLKALAILHLLDLPPSIVIPALAPYLSADNAKVRSFVLDWFQSHDNSGSDKSPLKPVNFENYVKYVRGITDVPTAFVEYIYERSPERALLVFFRAAGKGDTVAKLMEMRKKLESDQREREKQGLDTLPLSPVTNPPDKIPPHLQGKHSKEILLAEHVISNVIWLKKHDFHERLQQALPEAKEHLSKLAEQDQWWVRLYVTEIMRRHLELRLADVLDKLSDDSNSLVSKSAKSVGG